MWFVLIGDMLGEQHSFQFQSKVSALPLKCQPDRAVAVSGHCLGAVDVHEITSCLFCSLPQPDWLRSQRGKPSACRQRRAVKSTFSEASGVRQTDLEAASRGESFSGSRCAPPQTKPLQLCPSVVFPFWGASLTHSLGMGQPLITTE